MSYISVIERFHDYRDALHELLASILTGIAEPRILSDVGAMREAMASLSDHYPFVDLLYTLDAQGVQTSPNIAAPTVKTEENGQGRNRSQRPYFLRAREQDSVVVTEPYLSSANRRLCISACVRCGMQPREAAGYLVLDIDLAHAIEFLMGDTQRRRFQPLFKTVYSLISFGLFAVVGVLLYTAGREVFGLFEHIGVERLPTKPFGIIIFLTLALAIFDLGKTTLEEEVLMHKDIFRHSSTRRTITRFIAAILIAVSIEALLLMFKAALGHGEHLIEAVWMMFGAVGLLVGLGLYVYLGARAEASLLSERRKGSKQGKNA